MPLKTTFKIPASLCLKCRSAKMLCGLSYCPISISQSLERGAIKSVGNHLSGSTPPSLFVGRYGYPKIQVYPSSPPALGNTSIYEDSSRWLEMDMNSFLEMRLSLLRGGRFVEVTKASNPDYFLQDVQVLSLSRSPVDVEMVLAKPISDSGYVLSEYTPPMGPSAPLESLRIGTVKPDQSAEKIYYDTDLKAAPGIFSLYRSKLDVSSITRMLSIGALGEGKKRRIVPTRWAITATDKTLSDANVKVLKTMPSVDKFQAFVRQVNGNLFMAIVSPGSWRFEWGEAWFPGSTWNSFGDRVELMIDHEDYGGRSSYPDIGGCYYSSRLAVSEYLNSIGRSGAPILWREIYPNFNIPLGVWFVRENVRAMFKSHPMEFDTFDGALGYLSSFTKVPIRMWRGRSWVASSLKEPTLDRYF